MKPLAHYKAHVIVDDLVELPPNIWLLALHLLRFEIMHSIGLCLLLDYEVDVQLVGRASMGSSKEL